MLDKLFGQGRWYYTLTVLTMGMFAWVPFVHAASRTRDKGHRVKAMVYGGLSMLMIGISSMAESDAQGNVADGPASSVVGFLGVGIIIAACVQLGPARREAYRLRSLPAPPPAPLSPSDAAVADALAARERREEARQLVARDPALARELHIGRPDLPKEYDDGGLVDLNSAPAAVIESMCGISAAGAARLVERRGVHPDGFASIQEIVVYADLTEQEARRLEERGVLVPR